MCTATPIAANFGDEYTTEPAAGIVNERSRFYLRYMSSAEPATSPAAVIGHFDALFAAAKRCRSENCELLRSAEDADFMEEAPGALPPQSALPLTDFQRAIILRSRFLVDKIDETAATSIPDLYSCDPRRTAKGFAPSLEDSYWLLGPATKYPYNTSEEVTLDRRIAAHQHGVITFPGGFQCVETAYVLVGIIETALHLQPGSIKWAAHQRTAPYYHDRDSTKSSSKHRPPKHDHVHFLIPIRRSKHATTTTNDAIAATHVIAAAFDIIRGINPVLPVFGQGAKKLRSGAPLAIGINAQSSEKYKALTGTLGHPWQRRLAANLIFDHTTLQKLAGTIQNIDRDLPLAGFHIRTFRAQNMTFVREMSRQFEYGRDPFSSDWRELNQDLEPHRHRDPEEGFSQDDLIAMGVTELEKKRRYLAPSA